MKTTFLWSWPMHYLVLLHVSSMLTTSSPTIAHLIIQNVSSLRTMTNAFYMSTQTNYTRISSGAKTINVFRACIGAQLTICAQKLHCLVRWVWDLFWVEFVFFFIVLATGLRSALPALWFSVWPQVIRHNCHIPAPLYSLLQHMVQLIALPIAGYSLAGWNVA